MERIPIASAEAPKPAKEGEEQVIPEQKYEEKERKRTTHTEIKFDTSSHAIPPNQKTELRDLEVSLYKTDREFLDWKRVRNELEAYAYDMKSKCADQYGQLFNYIEPAQRDTFIASIAECVEWIYAAGETAPIVEYKDKLQAF